jgi:iron complex outermembrane receptor protein
MKQSLSLLFLLFFGFQLLAQHTVSGTITDLNTGQALIGVNIYVPELSRGVVSDKNGNYSIHNLPKGKNLLQFSFVGFKTVHQTLFLQNENIELNIELDELVLQGDEVVISGNFSGTQHENTVKISTIDSRQLEMSGSPSLIESISEIPGVEMISKGPGIGTPVIRGLSLSNILFLNNGVPMENFQFSENHPYMVDEYGIERIEVIKGPASLIYGSGAVGGVINLIDKAVSPEGSIEGDFNMKYFGNTTGLNTNLGIQGNQNGFIWGARAGINSNKDYRQGNSEIATNTRFNRQSAKLNIGLIRKSGSFKLQYQYNRDKLGLAVPPAFEIVKDNNRKNEVWFQDLYSHLISSRNKIFIGKFRLDVDLAYQFNNRLLKGSELTPVFDLVDMTLQTFTYRVKSSYSFNAKTNVIFGIQGMTQNNKNGDAPDHVLPDALLNDISVYGLAQYHAGSIAIIEAGLRYSFRKIDVPLQASSGDPNSDPIEYNGQFSNLSASVGATINLTEQMLIRLNLASAFRSPNLAELTQNGMQGTRFEEGNPDLETQQNLEIDLGYHLHTKHLTFGISAFYNNIFNYIHLSPTADTTGEGVDIYRYTQADAYLYGGEASIHLHPHPLHWLHLKSTYSYVIGRKKQGGYLPLIPAQKLKFDFRLTKSKWKGFRGLFVKAGVDFVFAQNNPSEFETETPAYTLVNLGAGFDVVVKHQRFSFSINANNLLDTAYFDHLSSLKPLGIYNMGRNVSFSIKIPFGIKTQSRNQF